MPRIVLLCLAFLPFGLFAQVRLVPTTGLSAGTVYGAVTKSTVAVSGQSFSQAVRLRTTSRPANYYDAGLTLPTIAAVAKDDVIAGEVWLRRLLPEGIDGLAIFNFEKAGPNYDKSHTAPLLNGSTNWTKFRFAFKSVGDYASGGGQVALHLGAQLQTIELGGLVMTNYAKTRPLSSFPNDITYSGREPEAPWRAPAAQRIEEYRKANLTVTVRDSAGHPVPGALVEVRQVRHAFGFGTAADGNRVLGRTGNANEQARYQSYLTNWFNRIVLENDLKWTVWEGINGRDTATNALRWFKARGIPVRGHNLIWPGTNAPVFLPADVPSLFDNPGALRTRISNHFADILGLTQGLCADWDVVNEPLHERAIEGVLGRDALVDWFRQARNLDRSAALYLNEFDNLETPNRDGTQRLLDLLLDLRRRGAPMDGVGLQSHFGSYLTAPQEVYDRISLVMNTGGSSPGPVAKAQITEFDVNVNDESAQADYVRDFLTVCFSHPQVEGVLMWGFWEGQHWQPNAALIRRNWEIKPSGIQYSNLVFREWWTTTNALADATGQVTLRGFKGDYRVRVTADGVASEMPLTLTSDTTKEVPLAITVPEVAADIVDGKVMIRWPVVAVGYHVERSEALVPPNWQPVTATPEVSGDHWQVRLGPELPPGFFRLTR
ncbi:MAG TPA: endo-1,4-beta-xylanase [Verrucomicrobiota bacterium]|nr:hypothetical protein [Verrucomicrobiales bacterium]HRI11694.1 endo-1,4-beta-xylanase [Verrucomicrobiota bacterium]